MNTSSDSNDVRFIYSNDQYDVDRERVATNVVYLARHFIEIPKQIEIEFKNLSKQMYGETLLDPRFKNRVRLQDGLSKKEIIVPLVHELLHLEQIHIGVLVAHRNGICSWRGKMYNLLERQYKHNEWATLPWEQDVANKQQDLLAKILSASGISKG